MAYRRSHRFFTLTELLVVIVIIMILAAMLLPALDLARDRALTAQCASRMRQIGVATTLYMADNKRYIEDLVEGNVYFTDHLDPYLSGIEEIWYCPAAKKSTATIGNGLTLYYGMNKWDCDNETSGLDPDLGSDDFWSGIGHPNPLYAPAIDKSASQTLYMADADPGESPHDIGGAQNGHTDIWPFTSLAEMRHINGYNALFLDQHVAWCRNEPNFEEWTVPRRKGPGIE